MSHFLRKSSIFFFFIFIIVISPFSKAFAFSGTGAGTMGDPYIITTCLQLQEMSDDLTASYKLGNNINCADTSNWNSGEGFVPIGSSTTPFTGFFNGNQYTILHLFINNPTADNQGLFGYAQGGGVSNVTITGSITGQDNTGGLIGYATQESISNNHSMVTVSGHDHVGGLIGGLIPNGIGGIIEGSFSGAVSGHQSVGGLVGLTDGGRTTNGIVSDSYATGTVSGNSILGGLIGFMANWGTIRDSYSQSNVTSVSDPDQAGGIGGLIGYDGGGTILRTYASGTIQGTVDGSIHSLGGLIGGLLMASGSTTISDSFSDADGGGSVNGFYGSIVTAGGGGETITLSNNYYTVLKANSHTCYFSSNQDETGCTGIIPSTNYWQVSSNDPLAAWDNTSMWDIGTTTYPTLQHNVAVSDTTAPTVLSVSPANVATNVHGDAPIVITFSEPMDSSTFAIMTGSTTYNQVWSSNDTVVTLTPQAGGLFNADTTYNFAITTAKDVAQNNIAAEYDFSFTTGHAPTLTQVTAIPSSVTAENAVYHFMTSEVCDIDAEETQGPGSIELLATQNPTPGTDLTVSFRGLRVNGTYTTGISCINSNHLISNRLAIGPFTVVPSPGVLSGGNANVTWTPQTGTVTHQIAPSPSVPSAASASTNSSASGGFTTRILKLGMSGPDVLALQQYLNTHKYPIAVSGVGSAGHETSSFGLLTKKAVMKFQKAHGLTADGTVGVKTRGMML